MKTQKLSSIGRKVMKMLLLCIVLMGCTLGWVANLYAEDVQMLSKEVVTQLAAHQFDKVEARFDSTMSSALPASKLAASWDAILAKDGSFKSITGIRLQDVKGYRVIFVTCQFERASLDVKLVWNAQDQISGLWFAPSQGSTTK